MSANKNKYKQMPKLFYIVQLKASVFLCSKDNSNLSCLLIQFRFSLLQQQCPFAAFAANLFPVSYTIINQSKRNTVSTVL